MLFADTVDRGTVTIRKCRHTETISRGKSPSSMDGVQGKAAAVSSRERRVVLLDCGGSLGIKQAESEKRRKETWNNGTS